MSSFGKSPVSSDLKISFSDLPTFAVPTSTSLGSQLSQIRTTATHGTQPTQDGKQQSPLASSGLNMETMSSLKEKLNTISFTLNNFIIQSYPSLVPSPTTSGPFNNSTPSLSVTATPTENVQASQGRRLNTTVLKILYTPTPAECILRCVEESCCRSVNYRKINNGSNCELLHANMSDNPQYLVEDVDFDYYTLLRPNREEYNESCFPPNFQNPKIKKYLNIHIRSEGSGDPDRSSGLGLGIIQVNGTDYSRHGRGHNVVTINASTGIVQQIKSFDTYEADADLMTDFLNSLEKRLLVLIAVQDDGSWGMTDAAYQALEKVGAQNPLRGNFRGSYALLGWSGPGAPNFITQVQNGEGNGPSIISKVIGFPIW